MYSDGSQEGGVCLVVELGSEGSATNGAIPYILPNNLYNEKVLYYGIAPYNCKKHD